MDLHIPGLFGGSAPGRGQWTLEAPASGGAATRNDPGFLSSDFPRAPPRLYVTAESDDFDLAALGDWRGEGFDVEYVPMGPSENAYRETVEALSKKKMGPCETFGIVAYGDAASFCLEHFHATAARNPEFRLACLIAYYPGRIPDPRAAFPGGVRALVHLAAGSEVDVARRGRALGLEGPPRVVRRAVGRGLGAAGALPDHAYPAYAYADAAPGFAERDLPQFDRVAADLAWSRSLAAARRAFRLDVDVEEVVDRNIEAKFFQRDAAQTMATYGAGGVHATYVPTLTGGVGRGELERFYGEFWAGRGGTPGSLRLRLLSRTASAGGRVVDETHVALRHTEPVPWLLPGVPSTGRRVELVVVTVAAVRAGRLCHEHAYWDQASVLAQVGLLDPRAVPAAFRARGVERLPVVGRRAARSLLRGYCEGEEGGDEGEATNELIAEWDDDFEEVEGEEEKEGRGEQGGGEEGGEGEAKDVNGQAGEERMPEEAPTKELKGKEPERLRSHQARVDDEEDGSK
ncbi:NTF2-like protein [Durotheca rogersii]|uniref:NTF2-like protein n=1 Tax=Durotheca rogersii TaxID=419775 RepID=UPI002220BB9C|nr:NTF2-like protein [Durotheca rogersii]KAI5861506.1 NTF2-like protein [Durotheca rogersii]